MEPMLNGSFGRHASEVMGLDDLWKFLPTLYLAYNLWEIKVNMPYMEHMAYRLDIHFLAGNCHKNPLKYEKKRMGSANIGRGSHTHKCSKSQGLIHPRHPSSTNTETYPSRTEPRVLVKTKNTHPKNHGISKTVGFGDPKEPSPRQTPGKLSSQLQVSL